MSFDDHFGGFEGEMGGFIPNMFADVMKMMKVQDPTQFELISQLAMSIVSEPNQGNVDPRDRIATEEFTRIAELHVADVTGMTIGQSGHPINVHALNQPAWVERSLARWKEILGSIVLARTSSVPSSDISDAEGADEAAMTKMMQQWFAMLAPTLAAMQIGSIIGHLAKRTHGQYDLLLPGDFSDGPAIVVENRKTFAVDWSLPESDVSLWMSVNDIALHSVMSRDHVSKRLHDLIVAHASTLNIDTDALQRQLESAMPSSMSELAEILGDTRTIESPQTSTTRLQHARELETLVTVIRGYADWVSKTVAERAIGARSLIAEAITRSRIERSEDEHAADSLMGVEHNAEMYERGRRFIQGIIDRNGERYLAQLWVVESNLPTPAELDAPGLWLERINL